MKKSIFILAALSASLVNAQTNDNWMASGQPVRNSTGLCWRDANWTPATAHPDCDGALKVQVAQASAPAQKVDITKPTAVIASPATTPKQMVKSSYSADTLFDFDKAVIKPEGKVVLDALVAKLRDINLDLIIAVGHTDSVGTQGYNLKLGLRRAQAVKAYFVAKGVESSRISVESRGEGMPIADNKTAQGRAKNRRVEIEVIGSAK